MNYLATLATEGCAAVIVCTWLALLITGVRSYWRGATRANWWPPQDEIVAAGATEEIAALIAAGRKIEAIKSLREEVDIGLYDAKVAVDGVLIKARTKRLREVGGSEQVVDSLARDNFRGAVRAYRQEAGVGRREAGDYVNALLARAKA